MALDQEAESEEEVKVEDHRRLFRPCIWINLSFTRLRVLAEGAVAVASSALEAENGCVPGGAVVGGDVGSGGVRYNFHIGLVRRSGGDAVICFYMTARTEGTAYSAVGKGVL